MKKVGLLLSEDAHHLDHLAPLCCLLNIALATNCPIIFKQGKTFYPKLHIFIKEKIELASFLVENFDTLISSIAKPLINLFLFPHVDLTGKTLTTLWTPHGHSDKGQSAPFFQALKDEDGLLYYGPNMLNVLKSKLDSLEEKKLFSLGNYRKDYFEKHAPFYKRLLTKTFSLQKTPKHTLLYAPTWKDSENSSSLENVLTQLVHSLPKTLHLIIKLHPHSLKKTSPKVALAIAHARALKNITLIENIPTILPILSHVDGLIGDMSSIGYDFLSFKKPMFFLPNASSNSPLFKCGYSIFPENYSSIFSIIERNMQPNPDMEKEKQILYKQVFASKPSINTLNWDTLPC
ncbi:hypothetical protein COB21_02785 [Candidatus Aerophobetes bacterium]|uniref:CDP-glycerol--glycerophosphate glycerophosphotransferase n=1 Tax=Aerophobetes bacterium TaxID=2030807 RepID=A0A2A4X5T0_UNCAE|nr:MAG: hypothetical protein COB21_02785 [Candidatus Aerophobetes bacterium]